VRGKGWHRPIHANGLCITCWRPNDRLPLVKCAFCARKAAVDRKLARIAARMTVLEEQEEALKAERHELRLEMAKRRIARGNKRGRQRKDPKADRSGFNAVLAAKAHPWQRSDRASYLKWEAQQEKA
jgi:hypothetical protein